MGVFWLRPAAQSAEYHLRRALFFARQLPGAESPRDAFVVVQNELEAAQPDLEGVGAFLDLFQPLRPVWKAIPYAGERVDSALQLWQALRYGTRVALNANDLIGDVLETREKGETGKNMLSSALAWVYQHQAQTHRLARDLHLTRLALESVRPATLPSEFRAEFQTYLPLFTELDDSLYALEPHLAAWLDALGFNGPRVYLILLQNNLELRPTGGFIGEYGVAEVELGDLVKLDIGDVYGFPATNTEKAGPLPVPWPLHDYYGVPYLSFRDVNWSPDFPTDAENASVYYRNEYGYSPFGVVAINLSVARHLLDVVGSVDIPASEAAITSSNFYERYLYLRSNNQDYKALLSDIMKKILARVKSAELAQTTSLVKTLSQELQEKDLLIYLHQEDLQNWIHAQNWDGAMSKLTSAGAGGDYIAINDANVNGYKNSSLAANEARADLSFDEAGTVHTTLVITTTNYADSTQRNYRRIYLPDRARVESFELKMLHDNEVVGQAQARWENNRVVTQTVSDPRGFILAQLNRHAWTIGDVTKELDKNVVSFVYLVAGPSLEGLAPDAGLTLTPRRGELTVLRLTYTVPQGLTQREGGSEYRLLIQKQPGAEPTTLTFNLISPNKKFLSLSSPSGVTDTPQAQFSLVRDEELVARFR